jgi:hypothetical protein
MKLSQNDLEELAKSTVRIESSRFDNDSPIMTIARKIFVAWMKERGEWVKYQRFFKDNQESLENAWTNARVPTDFLGRTRYEYTTYAEWCHFYDTISLELKKAYYKFYL